MIRSTRQGLSAHARCAGAIVVITFMGIASGCELPKVGSADRTSMVPSRTLTAHLGLVVDEAVRHAVDRGVLSPADVEDPAFVESVRRSIVAQYGDALLVHPETEDRFLRGGYDSADNSKTIVLLRSQLAESNVPLNTVEVYLADRFDNAELNAPELELTRRLLKAHFDAVLMGEILSAF